MLLSDQTLHDIRLEGVLCDEATGTGVLSGDGTLIQNCLLCGKESLNGYKFSPTSFGTANDDKVQKLYEGKLVFIDHTEPGKHPLNRKVKEFAGKVTNVRFDAEGRPRGDIETAYAPNGGLLRDLVKGGFKNVGLSHTAQYRFNKDKTVVESIENVFSVDCVIQPATTKSFHEHVLDDSDTPSKESVLEVEKLMAQLLEAQTALKSAEEKVKAADQRATEAENRLATVKTELETVSGELKGLKDEKEARESHDSLIKLLNDKGINTADSDICPESFIKTLLATAGDARDLLIEMKVAAIEAGKKISTEGTIKERKDTKVNKEGFDVKKALEAKDYFV